MHILPTPSSSASSQSASIHLYGKTIHRDRGRSRKKQHFLFLVCFIKLLYISCFSNIYMCVITSIIHICICIYIYVVIRFRLPASHPSISGFLLHSGTFRNNSVFSFDLSIYDFDFDSFRNLFFLAAGLPSSLASPRKSLNLSEIE